MDRVELGSFRFMVIVNKLFYKFLSKNGYILLRFRTCKFIWGEWMEK